MRVLVTGATGFVGRPLTLRLQRDGHQAVAWVRDETRARQVLGASVELTSDKSGPDAPEQAVAVAVDLAGRRR